MNNDENQYFFDFVSGIGLCCSGRLPSGSLTGPDPDTIAAEHMEMIERGEPDGDDYDRIFYS